LRIPFSKLEDFDPAKIAEQVPALKALMESRNKLRDLLSKADLSEELEGLLEKILQNGEDMQKISSELGVTKKED
jgi:type VI secretion system protein ImpB